MHEQVRQATNNLKVHPLHSRPVRPGSTSPPPHLCQGREGIVWVGTAVAQRIHPRHYLSGRSMVRISLRLQQKQQVSGTRSEWVSDCSRWCAGP
jgi:hypothetical protein